MISFRSMAFSFLIRGWKPVAHLLASRENKLIARCRDAGSDLSPIFILGPPRCGSTLTYQLLTENFLVEYFDNLSHALYRTPFLGNRISHSFFDDRGHGSFSSKGGGTIHEGWHAPSECPSYWYRAIPKGMHPVRSEDLGEGAKRDLGDPIRAIMGKNERPFLIKNLMLIERLDLVRDLFPDARYLIIKRDPLRTARSIAKERKRLGIPEKDWWSARPAELDKLKELPLYQKIAAQVHYLEKDIQRGLQEVPSKRKVHIRYEDLTADPKKILSGLKDTILSCTSPRSGHWNLPQTQKAPEAPDPEMERVMEGFHKLGLPYG